MEKLFLEVLNMSITAGYCVLAVVFIRLLLRKLPKIYSYILWSVVFFRLVCPVSIKSVFSLLRFNTNVVSDSLSSQATSGLNSDNTMSGVVDGIQDTAGHNTGVTSDLINNATGNIASDTINQAVSDVTVNAGSVEAGSNLLQNIITVAAIVWIVVALGLIVYSIISAIRLNKQLKNAVHIEANIFEVEDLSTPFVFGFIKPRIYLPASLAGHERSFVLMHELTHLRRKDYIIKQMALFIVCVHWFNPLAWLAFCLMSKDMEMSCDESVIAKLSMAEKADYSETLLSLAVDKRIVGLSPLAFGEGNVKGRIKNVLNYRKPVMWVSVVIVVILAAVLIGLGANPKDKENDGERLEIAGSSEEVTSTETENSSETETINVGEIDAENDPVEVIEAYVEYMGKDWNSFAKLHVSKLAREYVVYFNDEDNVSSNYGFYNIKGAEVLELVEIDFKDAEPFIGGSDSKKTVKTYAACIDYNTNENNMHYASGIEYDVISVVVEDGLWKISEVENTGRYVVALANKDYALSEEYIKAAIEKDKWAEDGFEAGELDKKYRGDAVMYYDIQSQIVDGHKLEPIEAVGYDINNLIRMNYYEQSGVSLYCYEVDIRDEEGDGYTTYNLVVEHNGKYQVFAADMNISFHNMFGYSSGFPEVYDREFDKGHEIDYNGDSELELIGTILLDYGSDGYSKYASIVLEYNSATGLYDFYYIEEYVPNIAVEAGEKFIEEYYGDYKISKYGDYIFKDGYIINVSNSLEVYINENSAFEGYTNVWGYPDSDGEEKLGYGKEIGKITFSLRYIGNGQFAVKPDKYQQLS